MLPRARWSRSDNAGSDRRSVRLTGVSDPETEELRLDQIAREREERRRADDAPLADEVEQHDRRADKAAYLREKLEARAQAERDA